MSYIELKNIKKSFDGKEILKDINLSIEQGEFVTFLGSSGCGKTTLLRCLIGLEAVDGGSITLDGKDITNMPAQQRGISMIFQQYCLFPTMNLYDNVSFGLRMSRVNKQEIKERVHDVLKLVNMQEHINKFPYQLSGGEQQRAALARGLIMNPKVLLLDEPFSAIDAKLRKELQIHLKEIHKALGMTSVFVTHDQEEAMRMSDTIHLFHEGILEQSASPCDIYAHPKTAYVAGFIGSYNLIREEIFKDLTGERLWAAIRPEVIQVSDTPFEKEGDYCYFEGTVVDQIPQGSIIREVVKIHENFCINVDAVFYSSFSQKTGDYLYLRVHKDDVVNV